MKPEAQMKARVVHALKKLDAHPVENSARAGTPDVECLAGWLELKVDHFRMDDTLALKILEPQQRTWLYRRWKLGGFAVLLVRTDRGWFMLDGVEAFRAPGKDEMWFRENCIASWKPKGPTDEELLECVRSNCGRAKTCSSPAAATR